MCVLAERGTMQQLLGGCAAVAFPYPLSLAGRCPRTVIEKETFRTLARHLHV